MALDTQLLYFLNSAVGQSPLIDSVIVFFASYLSYILIALFIAVLIFSHYHQTIDKLEILLTIGLSSIIARFGITELIRALYHRPRPFVMLDVNQLLTETSWSFPSGHATFFFAMATAIYLYNKKWGIFFFAATVLMTVSRVVSGIHYPFDIIGGAVIGIAVAYLTFSVARRIVEGRSKKITISTY